MSTVSIEPAAETWRVLLFARHGSELLVFKRPAGFSLPALTIPAGERIAAGLNAEARRLWKLDTVCVASFVIPHPGAGSGCARYHVMEALSADDLARIAPKTMDMATLEAEAFSDFRDFLAVRRAAGFEPELPCDQLGPFSDFGAFERICRWIEQELKPSGKTWNGEFRQFHATPSFALIRFATNSGAVWFKATGAPNQRESNISRCLSTLFPAYTPEILSFRDDWNAWLTDEIQGTGLASCGNYETWCQVAKSLAQLQIASIGRTPAILRSGAHDARSAKLISQITPFFSEIERLMDVQVKAVPPRLTASELQLLAGRMNEALAQLQALPVPDTLNHFDLNPENVIVRSADAKFLDWAEAAIAHPFLSFEYLRRHFSRQFGEEAGRAGELLDAYAQEWRALVAESAFHQAMELLPLVAPFAFAVTCLPWTSAHRDATTEAAGFLRGLARRMHREALELARAA